jgi:hypothetical protein
MNIRYTWIIVAYLLANETAGQGWQHYGSGSRLFDVQCLPDGSCVAIGNQSTDSSTVAYWLHLSAYGEVLSERSWGNSVADAQALLPQPAGEWWVYGQQQGQQLGATRINLQGDIVQQTLLPVHGQLRQGAIWGSNTLLAGSIVDSTTGFERAAWWLLDANQQTIGVGTDTLPLTAQVQDVALLNADSAWLLLSQLSEGINSSYDIKILSINELGETIHQKTIAIAGHQHPVCFTAPDADSARWIVGYSQHDDDSNVWLCRINAEGDTLGTVTLERAGWQVPQAAMVHPNGSLWIAGDTRATLNSPRNAFLAQLDSGGSQLRWQEFGGPKGDIFHDLAFFSTEELCLVGQTASVATGLPRAWVLRTNALGEVGSSRIEGRVGLDEIEDCLLSADEPPLSQWLVMAERNDERWYTHTDETGRYGFDLDTGSWLIRVWPVSNYWAACEEATMTLLQGDTVEFNMPVQAVFDCPLLQVEVSTPFLRRCFDNQYMLMYRNFGTIAAEQARIRVALDPALSVVSSSANYTVTGSVLEFELGTIPALSAGELSFVAHVSCDSSWLGQTHCVTAHITPDSSCFDIDSDWDGSSLEVNGYCAGDSVVLQITNVGAFDMQSAVEYIITEDQIIFKRATVLLQAGESQWVVLYPQGSTITIVVPQPNGHPGGGMPTLVVEGCGGGMVSVGYAFQFPNDDAALSTDTECRQNIGSYDPNDKIGLPLGFWRDGETYLLPETPIEYLIRFQNTGTDTAFRVEIRDTLSPWLDVATLEMGAASHVMRWRMVDGNTLVFTFDPIALPDSLNDLDGSQGFVKYRIRPVLTAPLGTGILNRAGIYFDHNAAVMTNYTLHRLGLPGPAVSSSADHQSVDNSGIRLYPQPAQHAVMVNWPHAPAGPCEVLLYDLTGKLWANTTVQNAAQCILNLSDHYPTVLQIVFKQQGTMVGQKILLRLK